MRKLGRQRRGVFFFGVIEIAIGGITLCAVLMSLIYGVSTKPMPVLIFVVVSAVISSLIGIGLIYRKTLSYRLLLYFSSLIILSKILIFAGIMTLTGDLETTVSPALKNVVSIVYHGLALAYFLRPSVKSFFKDA